MQIGINAHLLSFSASYRQAGLSRYIYELVTRVPQNAPQDRFTAFVGGGPPAWFLEQKAPNLHFMKSLLPTEKAPFRILWEQTALPLAAASARLDLLHCPVNVRPVISTCPVIVTVHDLVFLRYPDAFKPTKRRYLSAMTRWSCRHAAHVIAVSEATRQDVISLLGVSPNKVSTVHNGVGEGFTQLPAEQVAAFRRDKSITGRVILYVGTLEPRKNIPTLIRAFNTLASDPDFSDTTLVIGGSKGWYFNEIFSTAESFGLTQNGRVRFLGRVPDDELALWYNSANLFAYPSLYEGFGLPVLEAMSCGTPSLCSSGSAFPEVAGNAARMLDPLNTAVWTDKMKEILTSPELASGMAAQGLEQARQFSWETAARETAEIYRRVVTRTTPKQAT